ncbi:YdaS family helix-turn-helix protein [Pseudorhizobium sp. NPDC055634]
MDAVRDKVKSLAALARDLGVTRGALAQWDRVPAERVVEVSRLTGIPRQILRPDLYEELPEAAE